MEAQYLKLIEKIVDLIAKNANSPSTVQSLNQTLALLTRQEI